MQEQVLSVHWGNGLSSKISTIFFLIIVSLKTHNFARRNLTVHCSVTPFVIQQPIWRPHLLERVYKPMRTSH